MAVTEIILMVRGGDDKHFLVLRVERSATFYVVCMLGYPQGGGLVVIL
jgi:hypothetical protein